MRKRQEILHHGEMAAQERFTETDPWPEGALNRMFQNRISPAVTKFLEARPFFFIATANGEGRCDASFRAAEPDADGHPQPALKVLDEGTLVFPDFSGNNLFTSLGNILINPHIGMLFIDFERAMRMRVNGHAEILEDPRTHADIWPTALRYVQVTTEQVFGNCSKRIPRLLPVDGL